MISMAHKSIRISGRVQGVGFRYSTREVANIFSIYGFVKNQSDGSVYIEAEGSDESINAFLAWCKEGPPRSRIDNVSVMEGPYTGFTEFSIR